MKQKIIKRISDGKYVDLSKMNRKNLKRLHYEEERFVAQKILETRPFSEERADLMKQGYQLVNTIMPWYHSSVNKSYGANEQSKGLLEKPLSADGKTKILYEAGVGTGFSCERFVKLPNVLVKGCDILLCDKVRQLMEEYNNLQLDEEALYDNLKKKKDDSIDYFYADNVFEHLLPDEFPSILKLLYKKMKKGGLVVLIIPNRLIGPNDVSRYFLKRGEKAEGFHFMEMSYRETLVKFGEIGFEPMYYIWRDKSGEFKYIEDSTEVLNHIKVLAESIAGFFVRKTGAGIRIFYKMALSQYIFIKR